MSDNYLSNLYKFVPDLDAYFARIGYSGSREPTSETLRSIQWLHLQTIPFENLDVLLTGVVSIDPKDIQQKLVFEGRGGYCFEHNTYLMWVLRALGFNVIPILARNRWMKQVDVLTPQTHIILKVKIDDDLFIFDVGFSSNASAYPLKVHTEVAQETALETRRIIKRVDDSYMNQILVGSEWKDVFIFTLDESYPFDWEIGNFYVSKCSTFTLCENIVCAISTPTGRHSILNNTVSTRNVFDNTLESKVITSRVEYIRVLRELFKLKLSDDCPICPRNISWSE